MVDLKVPYEELVGVLNKILLKRNFSRERAYLSATLFAKANLDGVASHGLNRFPHYLQMISEGCINVNAEPEQTGSFGPFERWDGKLGPGNLNAHFCMKRAISAAKAHGMGCVTLRNTNHWMRGGNFGWQAVEKDCLGICFTNTKPNMPAWGGKEAKLGNNPLIVAIPRKKNPVVLDMALSQFSYGKINTYLKNKESLPYDGGFDQDGNLTRDPQKIMEKELALPAGLWKGAGLSLVLDILVSVLSEGHSTYEIGKHKEEYGISQFFLCFYLPKLGITSYPEEKIDEIIENFKSSSVFGSAKVRFPGENTLSTRRYNLENGIPVDPDIWESVLEEIR
ncbi:MAG: 3-dehydro-L-gulonate 2-dehydrogenase [Balneolales bacterium]